MRDEVHAAIQRYQTMAGLLQGMPEKVERQGEQDRERFGEKYVSVGADGKYVWHPLPIIRFMAEVYGIPLRESRDAVIEDARATGVSMTDAVTPPGDQAQQLFATSGNVLEVRELAQFMRELFADDERAARYWRDVVAHIETQCFVLEDTGAENWD